MKHTVSKKVVSVVLALVMILGIIPISSLTVFAAHRCPNCDEWIDGSPYCEQCNECDECCELCIECGVCADCSGWEICETCSGEEGYNICEDCAIDKGYHCPDCYECYFKTGLWCDECKRCAECVDICDECTAHLGEGIICVECAMEKESHCPECEECYFKSGLWCETCKRCDDCSPICDYCSEEMGEIICQECAIEEGLHCPECEGCYGDCGEEYCEECGICANCADICSSHNLCMECAIADGLHCPNCEACGEDETICEGCGEMCSGCADAFCFNCNLCSDCVQVCPDCGACSNCAEICPNCEERCSECVGICDDCGFCLECCQDIAAMAGCDCAEWVCVESPDWNEHFEEYHTSAGGHSARASIAWSWNSTYHWNACVYCDDSAHYSNRKAHTFDANGKCTVCGYMKNAKIQIIQQPKDSKYTPVCGPNETYDESNIAHFSVKAIGETELTYTWCRKVYSGGNWVYKPLTDPEEGENYEGPNLDIFVYTDSCYEDTYLCCIITDKKGNEVRTKEVVLGAAHNYQYYIFYKNHKTPYKTAERSRYGHVLQCVGEGCEHVTNLRPHEDGDQDGHCDICDYEIGEILVTKQPKDVKNVYVSSPDEDYDESNIAHFSVEAVGKSNLTYTWYRRQYVNNKLTYVPLQNPGKLENYEGPNLDILAPEDSCCNAYVYCCFITDEEGNQVKTIDAILRAKHNYQYYKYYQSHEQPFSTKKTQRTNGHILQCVGCGEVTKLRNHVDADNDYCCDICDYVKGIFYVELTVTAPKEGQKPGYTVGSASPAYYAAGGNSNYTQYRKWYVSDNGTDGWTLMNANSTFVAGKYYKFSVDVITASGREFATYSLVQDVWESGAWAVINGNYILPKKKNGQDPAHYLTVEYNFGVCNDSIVENISAVGVTAPVAGEKPSYSYSISGSGYQMNTAKNRYRNDYLPGASISVAEREYYIKNGIGWFDLTKSDWVYENETFIPGHQYQANVYLIAEDGYEFAHSKWYEPTVTATVNGYTAEAAITGSDCVRYQEVRYTFTCPQKDISQIELKLNLPRAGRTLADYPVTSLAADYYVPDQNYAFGGIYWYDDEGNMLEENDEFVQGVHYKVEIKLIPAKADGTNTSRFVSPVSAYINGEEVTDTEQNDWDAVYPSSNAVYIYYTFSKGASVAKSNANARVYGSITAFGDENGTGYVRIYAKGAPEPIDEKVFTGRSGNYEFFVSNGDYIVEIAKSKHATRTYAITVSSDTTLCDVTAWLYGDVTGDGNVNGTDAMQINRYAAGKASVFTQGDESLIAYRKLIGDVTGDGNINGTDAMQINRYAAGKNSVFNSFP